MHVEEGVDHVGCKQSSISILKKSLNIVGFFYILYNMIIQYTCIRLHPQCIRTAQISSILYIFCSTLETVHFLDE